MRQVLKDNTLENELNHKGVCKVNLLDAQEFKNLESLVNDLDELSQDKPYEVEASYKLSFFNSDLPYKKKVFNTVYDFFKPFVDQYLLGYKPLIINIFKKEPGMGEVPVHQNWTFVDESKYTSVSVWIPLTTVSRRNGTLEFVQGSHRILTPYRSPTIPWVFKDLFDQLREKYLKPQELTPGEALILDDSIIHWSSENHSEETRTAIQLIMIPEEADAIHYYWDEGPELEVLKVDPEFFMSFSMAERPAGQETLGKIPFEPVNLTESELVKKISKQNPSILQDAVL